MTFLWLSTRRYQSLKASSIRATVISTFDIPSQDFGIMLLLKGSVRGNFRFRDFGMCRENSTPWVRISWSYCSILPVNFTKSRFIQQIHAKCARGCLVLQRYQATMSNAVVTAVYRKFCFFIPYQIHWYSSRTGLSLILPFLQLKRFFLRTLKANAVALISI